LARHTGHLNADMDDRSVFNVALTAGEVKGLYDVAVDAQLDYNASAFEQLKRAPYEW
tara:strand:- start:60 stop:230 length:171 start_codon:yes stop_codon:yes gene_type:complete